MEEIQLLISEHSSTTYRTTLQEESVRNRMPGNQCEAITEAVGAATAADCGRIKLELARRGRLELARVYKDENQTAAAAAEATAYRRGDADFAGRRRAALRRHRQQEFPRSPHAYGAR